MSKARLSYPSDTDRITRFADKVDDFQRMTFGLSSEYSVMLRDGTKLAYFKPYRKSPEISITKGCNVYDRLSGYDVKELTAIVQSNRIRHHQSPGIVRAAWLVHRWCSMLAG